MDNLNTAVDLANIAIAANAFLKEKRAALQRDVLFDNISDMAVAARGILRNKTASATEFGVSDDMALSACIYDAAKGILRLRNLQQM